MGFQRTIETDDALPLDERQPRACANRQAQDLSLLALESCGCSPEQARRCAEEKRLDDFYLVMAGHAAQVEWLHSAASDILERFDEQSPPGWKITVNRDKQLVSVRRENWRRRKFREPHTKLLLDRDIGAAFVAMLYVADDLDAAYSRQHPRNIIPYCDASTLSARAYQAAAVVLTAYYHDNECVGPAAYGSDGVWRHHPFAVSDISAARIVTEVFDGHLLPRRVKRHWKAGEQFDPGVQDYFIVSKLLDKSSDLSRSSYTVGDMLGRHESTIRERFDRTLEAIDGQLGKYCKNYNTLAHPTQSAEHIGYNSSIFRETDNAVRLVLPRPLTEPQPERPSPSKADMACLGVLAWAQGRFREQATHLGLDDFAKRQCPSGLAQFVVPAGQRCGSGFLHYAVTQVDGERQYPDRPYRADDPAIIFWPQPAIDFVKHDDCPNEAHGAAGRQWWRGRPYAWGATQQRWARTYLNAGLTYRVAKENKKPKTRNDLVELFGANRFDAAHDETEDDPEFLRGSDQQSTITE